MSVLESFRVKNLFAILSMVTLTGARFFRSHSLQARDLFWPSHYIYDGGNLSIEKGCTCLTIKTHQLLRRLLKMAWARLLSLWAF